MAWHQNTLLPHLARMLVFVIFVVKTESVAPQTHSPFLKLPPYWVNAIRRQVGFLKPFNFQRLANCGTAHRRMNLIYRKQNQKWFKRHSRNHFLTIVKVRSLLEIISTVYKHDPGHEVTWSSLGIVCHYKVSHRRIKCNVETLCYKLCILNVNNINRALLVLVICWSFFFF